MAKRGVFFREIAADAWTPKGEKFAKSYMIKKNTKVHNNQETNVFTVQMFPPEFKPTGNKLKQLFKIYENEVNNRVGI